MLQARDTRFSIPFVLAITACQSIFPSGAFAQLSTAELNGLVTDQSGAVLPGVTVPVTQTATGLTRSTVTHGTGSYVLPNLPTGPYRLDVSLQGFKTYAQTGILLQVGAAPTINAVMVLGSVEESVTVVDLAISRLIPVGPQRLELRLESFNLLNYFNWGNPQANQLNFNSGQFGRITTQAGAPRIMQFGVNYDF